MKDFDFVKFTLWMAVVLLFGVIGGDWWLGRQLEDAEQSLARMKRELTEIGRISGKIDFLRTELESDKFVGYEDRPGSFFQACAQQAAMDPNQDYSITTREQPVVGGYQDTEFTLQFKPKREMPRRNLTALMFEVENRSPRVKLVAADLRLEPKEALEDRWSATLKFLRRDPIVSQ